VTPAPRTAAIKPTQTLDHRGRAVRQRGLAARLAALILLAVLPVTAFAVYGQIARRHEYLDQARLQASALLDALRAEQLTLIGGIRDLLAALAETSNVRERDFAVCLPYLQRLRASLATQIELAVTDGDSVVRCSTDPAGLGFNIRNRPHVQRALETRRFAMGDYFLRRTNGRAVLSFALPYRDADDRVAGVITALLDLGWLDAYLARRTLPPGAAFSLADRNGILLARTPSSPGLIGTRLPERFMGLLAGIRTGVAEATGLDGVERVVAYDPPGDEPVGLFIAVGLDKAAALAPADAALARSLAQVGGIVLLSLAVVWWGGRRLLRRPIATLIAAAERWGGGDLSARTRLAGAPGELVVLGEAFDEMADELQAREGALKAAEARYRSIVDTAVDAMVVINEQGAIQSFNPAAERMFGYAAEEALGRNVAMLMPEPHRSAHDGYLARYRQTGERRIIGIGREVEGRRKDGTTFPLELAVAEWRVEGQRFFTGIMRDITLRRQSEEGLRAAKLEAERASLAKSKFLAAASHDLRQPVQSLVLFVDLLKARLQQGLAGSTVDALERMGLEAGASHPSAMVALNSMERALDGLRTLLDSLLDVSRLDAGLVVAQPTVIPLGALLERLAGEYAPRAVAAGLRFRVVGTRAAVRSDPTLLERIVRNLLENALRYTERGGILLGCRHQQGRIRLEVVDTGVGIAPDKLEEVFEEFYQVGNLERDRAQGLGLGLAIVRRLARLLGHEIVVRSRPGQGSRFGVVLPLSEDRRDSGLGSSPPATLADPGLAAVLVIEDDPLILEGVRAILEDWGYNALAATSVEDAVAAVEEGGAPAIVLTDYRLKGGSTGLEAIRAVYARLGHVIPAAIMTGDTAAERLAEAKACGFRLLHKPVGPIELREAIRAMLQASRQAP
jgi:PAS domain S-box-containing protein